MSIVGRARIVARDLIGAALVASGWTALIRRTCARRGLTILIYHDPDPQTLRRHLAFLTRRYSIIGMEHAYQAWRQDRWDDLPPCPLVLTIDDGHAGNVALAPVLREFGVRPLIFLCSEIVGTRRAFWWQTRAARTIGIDALKTLPDRERRARLSAAGSASECEAPTRQALSWEDVRALGAVADFGGHTRTHPILTRCDDATGLDEVAGCRHDLEDRLGRPCLHFAYPNGDCDEREAGWVAETGYATARTVRSGWNRPDTPLLRLKGFLIPDQASVAWLAAKISAPADLPAEIAQAWRHARRHRAGRPAAGQGAGLIR
ncbi:polysaccharide deacetylase family protein [Azospirillum sp. TSO35-2]|uniref:polysaccharide deacetylase family protein n=1 Tax=Azospirillum sp. TSO35-2 TaxID=716796 RepID=UPI000D64CAFD|nr:polysaccharide deacetylase family protein [Azospirillum sp. TSO35-2]